jgi:hypothetical protein
MNLLEAWEFALAWCRKEYPNRVLTYTFVNEKVREIYCHQ